MIKRRGIIAAAQRYWRRDKWNNEYFDSAGYADFVLAIRDAEVQRLQMALADAEALELGTAEKCNQLRVELAAALAACKVKDEAILNDNYNLALSIQPDTSALEAVVKKAGEVMREKCADASIDLYSERSTFEAIHALPAVTLEDLK